MNENLTDEKIFFFVVNGFDMAKKTLMTNTL